MTKPRRKPAPALPETRGRPAIPPDTRRVTLVVRVPERIRDILDSRVAAHGRSASGKRKSSRGLEVERAVDNSPPRTL